MILRSKFILYISCRVKKTFLTTLNETVGGRERGWGVSHCFPFTNADLVSVGAPTKEEG
jgi:hypothetical protein